MMTRLSGSFFSETDLDNECVIKPVTNNMVFQILRVI